MRNPYAITVKDRNTEPARTVEWLLAHNQKQSQEFLTEEAKKDRLRYRREHPTLLGALKCIDGRLHVPTITKIPMGIIQPFRNIGGKFDIGWPYLQAVLYDWLEYAYSNGKKDCILFVTYHYSKGDPHRGCKGFNYDTEAAKAAASELRNRIHRIVAELTELKIAVILLGIETDEDTLILHGDDGEFIDLSNELDTDPEKLQKRVWSMFPSLNEWMLLDLMHLLINNVAHIKEVKASPPNLIEFDHCECCLGVGRGFDWLHVPNKALLIGGYSMDVRDPIEKAAGIMLDNIKSGRIQSEDGVVLMASALYWENGKLGLQKRLAIERAMTLAEYALKTIKGNRQLRPLLEHLSVIVGEVDMQTRFFRDRTELFWEHRNP